jgi:hypothetical protein
VIREITPIESLSMVANMGHLLVNFDKSRHERACRGLLFHLYRLVLPLWIIILTSISVF